MSRKFGLVMVQGRLRGNQAYVRDTTERWMELCALAAEEQDPIKLLALTQEIARLLKLKEQRLKGNSPSILPD